MEHLQKALIGLFHPKNNEFSWTKFCLTKEYQNRDLAISFCIGQNNETIPQLPNLEKKQKIFREIKT